MRRLWVLLLLIALPCAAHAQTATAGGTARPSPIEASEVLWSTSDFMLGYTVVSSGLIDGGKTGAPRTLALRFMSVTLTNTGDAPVESVRLAFVFSDPSSGEEWFRYKTRVKTRLLPGDGVVVEKVATASYGFPPRDMRAKKSVVVTEIKFADGSVWRHR